jgi:hypothetical protein
MQSDKGMIPQSDKGMIPIISDPLAAGREMDFVVGNSVALEPVERDLSLPPITRTELARYNSKRWNPNSESFASGARDRIFPARSLATVAARRWT